MVEHIKKRTRTYLAVGVGVMMLFVLTIALFNPTSVTFTSSAAEESQPMRIEKNALSTVDVQTDMLPSCIKRASYVPDLPGTSCLVSIQCATAELGKLASGCEVNNSVVNCY